MDSNGNQRKRGSRLNKNLSANESISPTNENEVTDVSAVAISPTLEEVVSPSPNVPAVLECRRSSRKKIIKFDVRDLLNKNRKTHKIQIEARIDSNAPSTSKATTARGSEAANSAAASTVRQDMLSKQKTFLEKSAIFRRYSISQEHKPPPLPLPMPPLLGKGNDNKEAIMSAASNTKRLSRTQEFFSNAMIKPKQTTSLIVAQIESNTPSSTTTTSTKRKNLNKSEEIESKVVSNLPTEIGPKVVQQKKRGRPARIKIQTPTVQATSTSTDGTAATSKKLTPEKAKNWKEYKACLAQQNNSTTDTHIEQKSIESILTDVDKDKVKTNRNKVSTITSDNSNIVTSKQTIEKTILYKPNKISLNVDDVKQNQQSVENVEMEKSELASKTKSEGAVETDTMMQIEKEIQKKSLNISKAFHEAEEDAKLLRNIQTDLNTETIDCNKKSEQETKKIDKSLESGSTQTVHNTRHQFKSKAAEILTVDEKERLPATKAEQEKKQEVQNPEESIKISPEIMDESVQSVIEIESNSSLENKEKVLQTTEASKESLTARDTSLTHPSTPTKETIKTYSRTSSSSESENASEHSSYSSAPSSASSSTPSSRSYKSNDKLRVTVKRLSLPKSPSTSSQTSTSEELNSNVLRKKPPMAKRSKRLQKKFFEKLDDQSSFDSVENTASISSISMESKFDVETEPKAGTSGLFLQKEKLEEQTQQVVKDASVTENVSTRKSLRIRKDNISESSDEYQSRERGMVKESNIQELKGKEIENITKEEHSEGKSKETEMQATTFEANKIKTPTVTKEQVEKQTSEPVNNSPMVEIKHVSTETNIEILMQEDLEKTNNYADSRDISTTVAAECIVTTAEQEVDTKIANIPCDKDNTIDMLNLEENYTENVTETETSNTSESSNSSLESNDKKNISEQNPLGSPKRKSLRKQKDKNTAEVISPTEANPKNDISVAKEHISGPILEDKIKLKHEENLKENTKVLPKRKARKSRFKNLHAREMESETDSSSTGKQTPIEEDNILPPTELKKVKENIVKIDTATDDQEQKITTTIEQQVIIEENKAQIIPQADAESLENVKQLSSEIIEIENVTEEYATSSNLLSSHIQNVSIETNTLLDILRTVQSNTEAALKASKSIKDSNNATILNSETTNEGKETLQQSTVLKISQEDAVESKTFSPTRFVVECPLTPNRIQASPSRSQSGSPFSHKNSKPTEQSKAELTLKASKSAEDPTTNECSGDTEHKKETIQQKELLQSPKVDNTTSKINSPTLSQVESPLTLKGIRTSTSPSQTPSPSNLKKSKHSGGQSKTEAVLNESKCIKESTIESEQTLQQLKKHSSTAKEDDGTSKATYPTRFEDESSLLTLKDTKGSRSQTASPLTFKKSKHAEHLGVEASKSTKDSCSMLVKETTNETEDTIQQQEKSSSPTLREVASPITLKVVQQTMPSRSQTSSPLTQKKSKRSGQSKSGTTLVSEAIDNQKTQTIQQDIPLITCKEEKAESKTNSPKHSKIGSPLTLKGMSISPSRSQTSSPLTHKKPKRTEQSNTETASSTNKTAKDSTAIIANESADNKEQIKEIVQEDKGSKEEQPETKANSPNHFNMESSLTLKSIQTSPSRSQTATPLTHKKSKRTVQSPPTLASESADTTEEPLSTSKEDEAVTKPNSPTRCEAESPLTLKGIQISPTRSQSASPLTHLKTKCSPSRSNSSSPLTLKKVTRRYERRSRRGDESTHKTLEETFAEIAAQSSQAVLAAKEIDIAEEEALVNKTLLDEPQTIATTLETSTNIKETTVQEYEEKATEIMKNLLDAIPLEGVIYNTATTTTTTALHEYEQANQECNISETKTLDNILEQEVSKTTPVRRGRKPKNRATDGPTAVPKDTDLKSTPKTDKEAELEHKLHEKESDDDKVKEETFTSDSTTPSPDDLEINKVARLESNENNTSLEQQTIAAENAHDNKVSKTSSKKRNTSKEHQEADAELPESTAGDTCKSNDEDDVVRTPKPKKRDSSQSKTETKSSSKKLTKKSKSNEEEQQTSMAQKDDINPIAASTPPASKRGRKPKNQQETTPPSDSGSKRKTKKDIATDDNKEEDLSKVKTKSVESENESKLDALDKTLDEKLAKKKRQKKLKEAFEAALADDMAKAKDAMTNSDSKPDTSSTFGLNSPDKSPTTVASPTNIKDFANESTKITCVTPVEVEEDPDPLKDIEKFIADGVNLLKKDYKLDEDSVDDVLTATTKAIAENIEEIPKETTKTTNIEVKTIVNTFETPADTPINTPSVTPPPKSPTPPQETSMVDENSGVRRSHRIKLITKTPKALVGRGLVRDKERFSIKDDVETKVHYTLDDHLTGLAEVEAKNAKFLKEMEERLSNFQVIKENEYLCERVVSREAKKMICDCFLTHEEEERGELGCGEDCLNRLLMIECGPDCNVKERCTNKRFQKLLCSPCRVFRTEKKGFGIMADIEILPGEFIMEYVGEVIDTEEFEKRRIMYSQDKNRHYYFMALRSDAIIDATIKGNISRFINHSCDPNAETQKWTVNGELRIGFFSRKSIMPGEEITFNYQYQRYGREAQRCYCESANCRGWIGQEPTSDEGEQIDDEDDESEDDEEEEEADTSNLLVHDDDEDSDASVADPEEVQKQLEMAAAQAEVELAPLKLLVEKDKKEESIAAEEKTSNETNKTENEEDSKSKFKKLLSKMAEKVAAKHKQNKREQKKQRKKKSKESSADLANKLKFSEDPDIEDEVEFLKECGLKNQSDTLRLSRLMVRAKLIETRLNLLEILRKGDLPCRRLFLDYHGLRLLHGWMSEDGGNMQIRLALLQTLETLPIANKTVLTDSKVMQAVRNWCGSNTTLSPNEDSSSSNSNSQDMPTPAATVLEESSDLQELQKLALKLATTWEGLPEIFRIPKKERIEQMKEHEREADRQYAANAETSESTTDNDRYRRDRFGRAGGGGGGGGLNSFNSTSNRFVKPNNGNPLRTSSTTPENIKNLSKAQRREMFAAKVARDEAEKRLNEERREFETKCRFFGLDPKKIRPKDVPFCVNPATGQWFSIERKPINTPPSYAHVQVPLKPKSTDPKDYQLPAVCATLPMQWKYAITPQGKIYYYHIKHRIPQWEPPTAAQLQQCENEDDEDSESEYRNTTGEESTDDDDDILIGMDALQLKAYIDRKVEARRQKRYQRLVDERAISPRREEDRIYNQIEVRKYKENKEKIRKRKEEIRRKRAEALRQSSLNMCTLGSVTESNANASTNKAQTKSDEELGALPIQDYLISSDEDDDIKAEVNSPLIDRIVEGDKIVDELDALTTKRQLKRPLPPHRDLSEPTTSQAPGVNPIIARQEYKKRKLEKKEKRKPKEQDAKYRKTKEKFRCEIAGIIVHHLKPYRKDTCTVGRIQSNEDFNHLARKLTHFVMIKELKYCESVGQTLVVTESVKSKSREFIKKYMAKYGDLYVKPTNDPDFKDIPFTL